MSVKITDRLPLFKLRAEIVLNNALREASRDIIVLSRTRAPFQKGGLRSDADIRQSGKLKWRVTYWKEYARYQEFGGDRRRTVRRYTTGGTGKSYLKGAGDTIAKNMPTILAKHGKRA
jgi:hypothetical protein